MIDISYWENDGWFKIGNRTPNGDIIPDSENGFVALMHNLEAVLLITPYTIGFVDFTIPKLQKENEEFLMTPTLEIKDWEDAVRISKELKKKMEIDDE